MAADHSEFRDPRTLAAIAALAADGCLVVDPWNCWGAGQVFAYRRAPVGVSGRVGGPAHRLLAKRTRGRSRTTPPGRQSLLVTGGAGTIGAAVVRRLLADPAYEVRVSDQRPAPQWMREGCEVHTGDLRVLERGQARDRRAAPT